MGGGVVGVGGVVVLGSHESGSGGEGWVIFHAAVRVINRHHMRLLRYIIA